jgi:hypothetical protein
MRATGIFYNLLSNKHLDEVSQPIAACDVVSTPHGWSGGRSQILIEARFALMHRVCLDTLSFRNGDARKSRVERPSALD